MTTKPISNNQAFTVPVFFTGQATAHGVQEADPETGALRVTCVGQGTGKQRTGQMYVYLDLRIDASSNPKNVGQKFRYFPSIPQNGMSDGQIKAGEAELKALKCSVADALGKLTDEVRAKINAAVGAKQYKIDFHNKVLHAWYEAKNPQAPSGKEHKGHPAYSQGFECVRWITTDVYGDIGSGKLQPAMKNTPLKGDGAPAMSKAAALAAGGPGAQMTDSGGPPVTPMAFNAGGQGATVATPPAGNTPWQQPGAEGTPPNGAGNPVVQQQVPPQQQQQAAPPDAADEFI